MSHIKKHASFEVYLDIFGKLDEETEGENQRKTKSEEEAYRDITGKVTTEDIEAEQICNEEEK